MPVLWSKLQSWLAARPDRYRPLVIPDPRGWRRIGHTIQLAFPGRSDQRKLATCLEARGLLVTEPPLGPVIHAVASCSAQFSIRFREEFSSFQAVRAKGASLERLYEEPLWSAVRSVAGLETEIGHLTRNAASFFLTSEDDGYELDLRLLARGPELFNGSPAVPTDDPVGEWDHVVIVDGSLSVAPGLILAGQTNLGALSSMAVGGLVAFSAGDSGALEVSTRQSLKTAEVALVRRDLVDEVRRRYGIQRWRTRPSQFAGWEVVRGFRLHGETDEALTGTGLERCWLLRLAPAPRSLRLVDGVSVEGSWLGYASLLPALSAPGSIAAEILDRGSWTALQSDGSNWLLPHMDLEGEIEIRCTFADQVIHRTFKFVKSPSAEAFKRIGNPGRWTMEGTARAISLEQLDAGFGDGPVVVPNTERTTFLEPAVGRFCKDETDAAWEVLDFADRRRVRNVRPIELVVPTSRSVSSRDRRLWRRRLDRAVPSGGDLAITAAVARIIRVSDRDLPTVEASSPELSEPVQISKEHHAAARAVAALTAIFNRRVNIERKLIMRVLVSTMNLPYETAGGVLRAWQECGLVDEVVNLHWSNRCFVGCAPSFEVSCTKDGYRASARGLILRETLHEVGSSLSRGRIEFETTRALTPFVPHGIVLRFNDLDQFKVIADRHRMPIKFLRNVPFGSATGRDLHGAPPGNYEADCDRRSDDAWTTRWWKAGAPTYWTVDNGEFRTWTHFRESARFWSAAFTRTDVLRRGNDKRFDLVGAHMPLSAAKWLSSAGGVLSGPLDSSMSAYSYGTPTTAMADAIQDDLQNFIESQLPNFAIQ